MMSERQIWILRAGRKAGSGMYVAEYLPHLSFSHERNEALRFEDYEEAFRVMKSIHFTTRLVKLKAK